ncbi:MAG: dienelactone hydrolase family protein [Verrucomicrobiota bacterium]
MSLLLASELALPAQDWARARLDRSPRHQEWVTLTNGTRPVQCFVVYPEVKAKATALVMIHEIFGLTDWAREMADELAAEGYLVVEPDLLSGAGPNAGGSDSFTNNQGAATKAVSLLPAEQVTGDLNAAVDYAAKIPSANGNVAVVGFCWGGGQAFRLAISNKVLKAAFVFYGPPPQRPDSEAKISCPVYGFYGGNDQRVTVTIPTAAEAMRAAGKRYEPVVYDGAGHGFMRAGEAPDASAANRKARDAALRRLLDLLKNI